MSTIFRLLTVSLLFATHLTQPVLRFNFDDRAYNNYIKFAEDELDNIKANLSSEEKLWIGISYYTKELYRLQKTFLKALLRCIKNTKDDDFFHQFESEIYKQWKNDFKRNYKNSLSTGDWSWVHCRFTFARWE